MARSYDTGRYRDLVTASVVPSALVLEWALKEVDLTLRTADGAGVPLLAALSRQWHTAVETGHRREDISAARLALERRSSSGFGSGVAPDDGC
jgi:3-hydroxyisobutyrate dehydrogenase-like beta-hydroxyacid dehydrogenase